MLFNVRSKYFTTVGYIAIMAGAVSSKIRGLILADSIVLPLCSILKSRRMRWARSLACIRRIREVFTHRVFWWKSLKGLTIWNFMTEINEYYSNKSYRNKERGSGLSSCGSG
jgi:hypothetical protein